MSKMKCTLGTIDSARKLYEIIFCYFSTILLLIKIHGTHDLEANLMPAVLD